MVAHEGKAFWVGKQPEDLEVDLVGVQIMFGKQQTSRGVQTAREILTQHDRCLKER